MFPFTLVVKLRPLGREELLLYNRMFRFMLKRISGSGEGRPSPLQACVLPEENPKKSDFLSAVTTGNREKRSRNTFLRSGRGESDRRKPGRSASWRKSRKRFRCAENRIRSSPPVRGTSPALVPGRQKKAAEGGSAAGKTEGNGISGRRELLFILVDSEMNSIPGGTPCCSQK